MAARTPPPNTATRAVRHGSSLTRLAASLLGLLALPAAASPLLDINFDNVSGLATQGSVKTIASVLSAAGELPAGTVATQVRGVNVRRSDDSINTLSWASTTGFGSFFTPAGAANKFLVLGDQQGGIGDAVGVGTFLVALPFLVPTLGQFTVSFDFAFNGTDTSIANVDIFSARIVDQLNPQNFFDLLSPLASPAFGSGQVESTLDISGNLASLAGHASYLEFKLVQGGSGTNTAVGIDNIRVVPEPGSALLLGIGLAALTATRRKRHEPA
jgi:hypothetical protein